MIDGVGTEEAGAPEVEADGVGEPVGDGDGDGVKPRGVVRGSEVVSVDRTKDVAVDPFSSFSSTGLGLGLVRSGAGERKKDE